MDCFSVQTKNRTRKLSERKVGYNLIKLTTVATVSRCLMLLTSNCIAFIFYFLIFTICAGVNDQTLVPDAAGCEVAKAALDRVKSSGIFKTDDKFLLVRVAYTSKFGKKVSVPGTKGIWHLPQPSLKKAQDISAKLNYVDKIRNILCIEFEKANFEDYRKPLYSAVGAALLIEEEDKSIPLRSLKKEQLEMWKKDSMVTNEIDKLWDTAAKILDENKGEADTQCFVCIEPPTDVCIAIDESRSVSPKYVLLKLSPKVFARIMTPLN